MKTQIHSRKGEIIINRYIMGIKQKTGVCSWETWDFIVITDESAEYVTDAIFEAQKEFNFESPVDLMDYVCDAYDWKWEDFKYDIKIKM